MTCPVSILILAITLFVSQTYHATVPETGEEMASSNPLTSHILDTTRGLPASNVKIVLHQMNKVTNQWVFINEALTNNDGRVGNLISGEKFTKGVYKLSFDTKSYFDRQGVKAFYPFIDIVFEVEKPEEHHHVPIVLNPYGYSTYRGS